LSEYALGNSDYIPNDGSNIRDRLIKARDSAIRELEIRCKNNTAIRQAYKETTDTVYFSATDGAISDIDNEDELAQRDSLDADKRAKIDSAIEEHMYKVEEASKAVLEGDISKAEKLPGELVKTAVEVSPKENKKRKIFKNGFFRHVGEYLKRYGPQIATKLGALAANVIVPGGGALAEVVKAGVGCAIWAGGKGLAKKIEEANKDDKQIGQNELEM
jgi:hypothetical protein